MRFATRTHTRRAVAGLLALTIGLSLAACGSDDDGKAPSATRTDRNGNLYSDVDVQFATDMIPHHAQAMQMVAISQDRPLDPEVRQLAEGIQAAQTPEIETMVDWLTTWGEDIPATAMDHANAGHDMDDLGDMSDMEGLEGTEDMPGMMSADEIRELSDASDTEFQDLWLRMMIEHHQGAIEMAKDEQRDGTFKDAVTLAKSIETSQQAEIDTMEGLLDSD